MSQIPSPISLPQLVYKGIPVITTDTLAQAYEVETHQIRQNFKNNKERFVEGKHLFSLSGNDLREFKHGVENFYSVPKNVNALILWTERGAARHAKMLNSDRAWDVFELLEETFFRVAAERPAEPVGNPDQLTPAHRAELKGIVDAKLSTYPASVQGKARSEIWARFNRHFRIAEYAQLPAERMAEARDYLIELEVKALKALPEPELPLQAFRDRFPADMDTGRRDALCKIRSIMDSMLAARDVVSLFCYPEPVSIDKPLAARLTYNARHDFYAAALDCLGAAYAALEAGYRLNRPHGRG